MTAPDIEHIARALGGARKAGKGYNCRCPAHDDAKASLNVAIENDRLLVHCYAGCDQRVVLDALRERGLANGRDRSAAFDFAIAGVGLPVRLWTYRDAAGARELLKVGRYHTSTGKEFRPWIPNGARWKCGAHPPPRPLYGLDLLAKRPTSPVLVTEGEKACDAARELVGDHYVVITWPGGANAADKADWMPVRGRQVTLWPDADAAGEKAMRGVATKVGSIAASVAIIAPGERTKGWDLADAKAEGWTGDDVTTYIDEHSRTIERPAPSTPLPLIWARDAGPMLDVHHIIKGLLGPGELVVVYGPPKSGKTFLAADLGLSVAARRAWFGHRVQSGLVLYVASEMGDRVQRRVRAWLDRHHFDDVPFVIVPRAVNLLDELDVERLVDTLDSLVPAHGKPVLIVVDTLARSMAGGDENSAQDMGRAVAVGDLLRDRFNAATLIIHHTGKDVAKGSRGSSALLGAADVYIRVETEDTGEHVATVEWSRDGESGQRYAFGLPVVTLGTDTDGDPVTTCIVEHIDAAGTPAPKRRERVALSPGTTLVLQAIRSATGAHGEHGATLPDAGVPVNVRAVALGHVRDQHRRMYGERDKDAQRTERASRVAFSRGLDDLAARGFIRISGPYVWQIPTG